MENKIKQTDKKRKKRVLFIAGAILLVLALLIGSALLGAHIFKSWLFKSENIEPANVYYLDVTTTDFKCIPATDSDGYLLVGSEVFDSSDWQSFGGRVNILPDILPNQYLVSYISRTVDFTYYIPNIQYWKYSYFNRFEITIYDIDNSDEPLDEIDVIELLEQQYPGYTLANARSGWDLANGYATYYNGDPCVILRVYSYEQDNRSGYTYGDEIPVQLMAFDLDTKVFFPVGNDDILSGRENNNGKAGNLNSLLGENAEFRMKNNIPFTARTDRYIEGGVVLRLEAISLEGYDAPILDMFPTLLEEAANMQWGSRMEIHLYDLTDDEVVELVTPR